MMPREEGNKVNKPHRHHTLDTRYTGHKGSEALLLKPTLNTVTWGRDFLLSQQRLSQHTRSLYIRGQNQHWPMRDQSHKIQWEVTLSQGAQHKKKWLTERRTIRP